jgi:hypothetical protein
MGHKVAEVQSGSSLNLPEEIKQIYEYYCLMVYCLWISIMFGKDMLPPTSGQKSEIFESGYAEYCKYLHRVLL